MDSSESGQMSITSNYFTETRQSMVSNVWWLGVKWLIPKYKDVCGPSRALWEDNNLHRHSTISADIIRSALVRRLSWHPIPLPPLTYKRQNGWNIQDWAGQRSSSELNQGSYPAVPRTVPALPCRLCKGSLTFPHLARGSNPTKAVTVLMGVGEG